MSLLTLLRLITHHPLNHNDKIGAVIRFIKWQIASRLLPGSVVYDWVNHSRFLVRQGETGLTGNIYNGLHEFPDMAFLLHFLRAADLFVDVGANAGSYSILAGAAVGANVMAFEPVPSTYERLLDNIQLNRLDVTVEALNRAVGHEWGEIAFTVDMDTVNHVLAKDEQHDRTLLVQVSTLDDELKDKSPILIKIDVEGYETLVLQGAQKTLANSALRAVIMELNDSGSRYGFDEARILQTMLDCGFKTFTYEPFIRRLIPLDGKNSSSGNTLFIRDESFVKQRVQSAAKFKVHSREL